MHEIVKGNAVEWANKHEGDLYHAILCDPPYHLMSKTGGASRTYGGYGRRDAPVVAGGGFMGKEWDGGDVSFRPETWEAFGKVLHPGAFGMAFASSRGWHRLAIAIEDAGFMIHPSIFGWATGQGFPKATRVDDQVDKAAGVERRVIGARHGASNGDGANVVYGAYQSKEGGQYVETGATSDMAKRWVGHRYGLQALKPALEPIIVFQKPYDGKALGCITETGAGALNIDGTRIATDDDLARAMTPPKGWANRSEFNGTVTDDWKKGRWPSNLVLLDDKAGEAMDTQAGMEASRFFYRVSERLDEADPVFYVSKASRREREAGLSDLPITSEGWSNGAQGNGEGYDKGQDIGLNRVVKARNHHPTVKPIQLARYLAKMLLPPSEYNPRRLFVPFSGVASEVIGALQAGWDNVTGVELDMDNEYIEIANKRIAFYMGALCRP